VSQLGWYVSGMARYVAKNGWILGIKNGKWIGKEDKGTTNLEKTWSGLVSYAKSRGLNNINIIHRGVDTDTERKERNLPVHEIAYKVKKTTGTKLYFDPSHIYGPRLKGRIIDETLQALALVVQNEFLYDGLLIEVGDSRTDSAQHISIADLTNLCQRLSLFRKFETRK
ncbi:MAG: hypothetical protein U9Q67_03110, partial [Patescibacteria group bacterium]|nr:hypothetical protein [Patescibacteria group bacterium]